MENIGPIFGEFITTEKIKRRRNYDEEGSPHGMKFYLIPLVFIISTLLILGRLFFLQVAQGNYFRTLSDTNRIKTIVIHAPRGIINDRQGRPLVYNVPGFRQIAHGKTELIGEEEAIAMLASGMQNLEIDSLRQYPYKEATSHVLGYLGQISEDELKLEEYQDYQIADLVGKMGIERQYESFLRGEDGKQLAEIDSKGKIVRKLGETDATAGRNITLTLDLPLQKKAFGAMSKVTKGAAIVSTPKGEVLALVSKPSFDPNLFTLGKDYKTGSQSSYGSIPEIIEDTKREPFLNRAISGLYPPGSTFKLITAAAGLQKGIIDTSFSVKDTGILRVGEFSFANWYFTDYGGVEGDVNVVKGIKRSNDIFFYKLAEKVGIKKLSEMAREFRVDNTLGIDLLGEEKGLVPTDEWKKKFIGESWYLGDTYHVGIGQGYILASPLSVNSWAASIAADGTLYRPYILKDLGQHVLNRNFLREETINPIREGMIESCAKGGVAWPLFEFRVRNEKLKVDGRNVLPVATGSADLRQITVACKTGTAQHGGENTMPHAWITLFAPAYDPEIVVTVLAEESGEGSSVAAPIAKKILEEWFSR